MEFICAKNSYTTSHENFRPLRFNRRPRNAICPSGTWYTFAEMSL